MKMLRAFLVLSLCFALFAEGQNGNSFNKVRYQGGTLQTNVKPDDWDNKIIVTPDMVTITLKDGQDLEIFPSKIVSLGYGQEANRRVGTMVALGIIFAPIALFGLFHKTRKHYVSIEFETEDGKKSAVLLQAHKDNYKSMLVALKGVSEVPISVAESEAKYVPAGVEISQVKESKDNKEKNAKSNESEKATISVTSKPDGADIYVDDAFVGNAPAELKLLAGIHQIRITLLGHQEWHKCTFAICNLQSTICNKKRRVPEVGVEPTRCVSSAGF